MPTHKVAPEKKRLDFKFFQEQQDWSYESFWSFLGEKLHIRIRRDAYDFQSYARCEIYDPTQRKWNLLTSVPHGQMRCLPVSYVQRPPLSDEAKELFHEDEEMLLHLAAQVLQ